jgi:hypothetical protein
MITETVVIKIKDGNLSFSDRERIINTQILKQIDSFKSKGFIVIDHNILNKNNSHATVNFSLKRMVG